MSEDLRKDMDAVDLAQQKELDLNREVDAAQQSALDENTRVDAKQQNQIDSLMKNQVFMFLMVIIAAIGSLFQIWESITVWLRLK